MATDQSKIDKDQIRQRLALLKKDLARKQKKLQKIERVQKAKDHVRQKIREQDEIARHEASDCGSVQDIVLSAQCSANSGVFQENNELNRQSKTKPRRRTSVQFVDLKETKVSESSMDNVKTGKVENSEGTEKMKVESCTKDIVTTIIEDKHISLISSSKLSPGNVGYTTQDSKEFLKRQHLRDKNKGIDKSEILANVDVSESSTKLREEESADSLDSDELIGSSQADFVSVKKVATGSPRLRLHQAKKNKTQLNKLQDKKASRAESPMTLLETKVDLQFTHGVKKEISISESNLASCTHDEKAVEQDSGKSLEIKCEIKDSDSLDSCPIPDTQYEFVDKPSRRKSISRTKPRKPLKCSDAPTYQITEIEDKSQDKKISDISRVKKNIPDRKLEAIPDVCESLKESSVKPNLKQKRLSRRSVDVLDFAFLDEDEGGDMYSQIKSRRGRRGRHSWAPSGSSEESQLSAILNASLLLAGSQASQDTMLDNDSGPGTASQDTVDSNIVEPTQVSEAASVKQMFDKLIIRSSVPSEFKLPEKEYGTLINDCQKLKSTELYGAVSSTGKESNGKPDRPVGIECVDSVSAEATQSSGSVLMSQGSITTVSSQVNTNDEDVAVIRRRARGRAKGRKGSRGRGRGRKPSATADIMSSSLSQCSDSQHSESLLQERNASVQVADVQEEADKSLPTGIHGKTGIKHDGDTAKSMANQSGQDMLGRHGDIQVQLQQKHLKLHQVIEVGEDAEISCLSGSQAVFEGRSVSVLASCTPGHVHLWSCVHDDQWRQLHVFKDDIEQVSTSLCTLPSSDGVVMVRASGCKGHIRIQVLGYTAARQPWSHTIVEEQSISPVLLCPLSSTIVCVSVGQRVTHYTLSSDYTTVEKSCDLPGPDDVIVSVVPIQGIPHALLGVAPSKIYIWNTKCGVLLAQIESHCQIKQCLSAQNETGLVFVSVVLDKGDAAGCLLAVNPVTSKCIQISSWESRKVFESVASYSIQKSNRLRSAAVRNGLVCGAAEDGLVSIWSVWSGQLLLQQQDSKQNFSRVHLQRDTQRSGIDIMAAVSGDSLHVYQLKH